MITLSPGVRYRVVHQSKTVQRYARESVMIYLGMGGPGDTEAQFSARPVAGTQGLRLDEIISATPVPEDTDIYLNRRAPS